MGRIILKTARKSGTLSRIHCNVLNSWRLVSPEPSGARVKHIISPPNSDKLFLFKLPKYGEFETQTEIFNSILSSELDIRHTQYFPGHITGYGDGVFCPRFLIESNKEEGANEELWETKELICRHSSCPNLDQMYGRDADVLKEHNFDNIYLILDTEFGETVIPGFFEMIGLDILIGHGDRHWQNYGSIVSVRPLKVRFAPIYDTASGYLVEHNEEKAAQMLKSDLLDPVWYRPKIKGLCKITVPNDIKSNHFDLLEHILANQQFRKYRYYIQKAFKNYSPQLSRAILNRFLPNLSPTRRGVVEKILEMRWHIGNEIFNRYKV